MPFIATQGCFVWFSPLSRAHIQLQAACLSGIALKISRKLRAQTDNRQTDRFSYAWRCWGNSTREDNAAPFIKGRGKPATMIKLVSKQDHVNISCLGIPRFQERSGQEGTFRLSRHHPAPYSRPERGFMKRAGHASSSVSWRHPVPRSPVVFKPSPKHGLVYHEDYNSEHMA